MDFSILKALSASARGQVSSLKSQAKRLHGASASVFGLAYSKSTCQEAIARANGYRNWTEIENLAIGVGQDRSLPFWHLHARTELHEACLGALIDTDVEMSQSRAVVLLGDVQLAAVPAVALWVEQISNRKVPGIIAIDTKLATFQKTPVGLAAKKLGLGEMFQKFRVIDARGDSLPFALTATPREWAGALESALSSEDCEALKKYSAFIDVEHLMMWHGRDRYPGVEGDVDSYVLERARISLHAPDSLNLPDDLSGDETAKYLHRHIERDVKNLEHGPLGRLKQLMDEVRTIASTTGILLRNEALHRPTVVLFDADNPVSVVIASLIHNMYFQRFVSSRAIRPILYSSTENREQLPKFLMFGNETVIVNGEANSKAPMWGTHITSQPIFVDVVVDGITVSGKWAAIGEKKLEANATKSEFQVEAANLIFEAFCLLRRLSRMNLNTRGTSYMYRLCDAAHNIPIAMVSENSQSQSSVSRDMDELRFLIKEMQSQLCYFVDPM